MGQPESFHDPWQGLIHRGQQLAERWQEMPDMKKYAYYVMAGISALAFVFFAATISISRAIPPKRQQAETSVQGSAAAKPADTAQTLGIDQKRFPMGPLKAPVARKAYCVPPSKLQKQK